MAKRKVKAKPRYEPVEPRPAAFSYGSILEDWVARGEPTIFHRPVSASERRRREAKIRKTWRVE